MPNVPDAPASQTSDAASGALEGPGGEGFRAFDRMIQAQLARITGGLSPAALGLAVADWAIHLAASPGKQLDLGLQALRAGERLNTYALRAAFDPSAPPGRPAENDDRFRDPDWQTWPYCLYAQNFLLAQAWWHAATRDVPGVSRHHEGVVSFLARQALDVVSPANGVLTNPQVLRRARQTQGLSLVQGLRNLMEDLDRRRSGAPPVGAEAFVPGREVAVTPGQVIYRNALIELIQYAPANPVVKAQPVLIVPAWIMKYYILDLSPHNSLVRYLVEQGHTVFCISWRNVTAQDRDLGLEEYRRAGVMAALEVINAIVPGEKVHAAGYCLGGTLLAIAAAAMARTGEDRLASISLFAAQTDFTEPGELELFIDESELHFLDCMMWDQGYLSADQMAGAFQMLRSNDLVWSRMVRDYLMGDRAPMIDLMAWNADATRMPYRMHSDYLRYLFLNNDLASGRYFVEGHPVALKNLKVPLFVVGTERDHVAPWRSVFKIHYLTDTDLTFVLTSGGHNAGIVSEPGRPRRRYRLRHRAAGELCLGPDDWVAATSPRDGSWWEAWADFLSGSGSGREGAPPSMGAPDAGYPPLMPAPGAYVMQR